MIKVKMRYDTLPAHKIILDLEPAVSANSFLSVFVLKIVYLMYDSNALF